MAHFNKGTTTHPRTVVITGAARGIGREIALAFARAGERVIVADLDESGVQKLAAEIARDGGDARPLAVDISDRESTDALATFAAAAGGSGSIEVVVNNAALYRGLTRSRFEDIPDEEWDRVLSVNVKGPWQVTRACSPFLRSGSHIVNVGSAAVLSGSPHWAHYVASKAAIVGLTRVMANELGDRGITVNTVAPGFTLTEASFALVDDAASHSIGAGAIRRAILPEDVVGTVRFLASDAAALVTGQTVVVDAGRRFL